MKKKNPGENPGVSHQQNKPVDKQQPVSYKVASALLHSPNIPNNLSGGPPTQETGKGNPRKIVQPSQVEILKASRDILPDCLKKLLKFITLILVMVSQVYTCIKSQVINFIGYTLFCIHCNSIKL